MTLKPLIVKVFPGIVEVRLSSSDRDQNWELSMSPGPPTIGTKSTRTPQRTQGDTLSASRLSNINEDTGVAGEGHQERRRNSHPGRRGEP